MKIQEDQNIGELVAHDYRTASVFKKYGIDFCCQGNRTIQDACEKKKVDAHEVLNDLQSVVKESPDHNIDFQSWPADLLADYIEKTHHRFVETKTQEITPFLDKVCRVHGERHPELLQIRENFLATAGELAMHMKREELVLFPYIRKMVQARLDETEIKAPHFGSVQNPITMMMQEHASEGERFASIRNLTEDYTPPADACMTYRVTYSLLREFEEDLHKHIHLENNILFPEAIRMEKELNMN